MIIRITQQDIGLILLRGLDFLIGEFEDEGSAELAIKEWCKTKNQQFTNICFKTNWITCKYCYFKMEIE